MAPLLSNEEAIDIFPGLNHKFRSRPGVLGPHGPRVPLHRDAYPSIAS